MKLYEYIVCNIYVSPARCAHMALHTMPQDNVALEFNGGALTNLDSQ